MPYKIRDPKRDHNLENSPHVRPLSPNPECLFEPDSRTFPGRSATATVALSSVAGGIRVFRFRLLGQQLRVRLFLRGFRVLNVFVSVLGFGSHDTP